MTQTATKKKKAGRRRDPRTGRYVKAKAPAKPKAKKRTAAQQRAHDQAKAAAQAEASSEIHARQRRALRDIAPLPPGPAGKIRYKGRNRLATSLRKLSDESLLDHLRICYPAAFPLEFGPDHLRLIEDIQRTIDHGGLKALAMPRGSGKSTIIVRAAIWAIVTGRRRFVGIIAAIRDAAVELLDDIKQEILTNPILAQLYGQEIHALKSLGGESRLAGGQRFDGELTGVEWKESRLKFGHIPGLVSAGAIIYTAGVTGNIRGPNITLATGEVLRPDLLLVDDIQTRESAAKEEQNDKRHKILMGDALGVAGPDKEIAALFTGTVVYKNDAVDRVLDRKKSPMWNGDKCQMVYQWPDDQTGWDEFRQILESDLAEGLGTERATQYVRDNYARLHKGSRVGWKDRRPGCASALQHAYTLRFRDEETFWAEYMNAPLSDVAAKVYELDAQDLMERTNQVPEWEVPAGVEKLTAFIDIQKNCLFYLVQGFEPSGRSHVLSCGAYPNQNRLFYTKRDLSPTLQQVTKTSGTAEAIWAGLEFLVEFLLEKEFLEEGGRRGDVVLEISRLGIDARWGDHTDLIRRFCRESRFRSRLVPMFGHYIGAKSKQWQRWKHGKRDIIGRHCKMVPPPRGRGLREMIVDTNYWKTLTAEKLSCLPGADHATLFYQAPPYVHRLLATHCTAEESSLETADNGQAVVEWDNPDKKDEDLWDCLVGSMVLSALEGVNHDPRNATRGDHEEDTQEPDRGEEPDQEPDGGPGPGPEGPDAQGDQPEPDPGPDRVRPVQPVRGLPAGDDRVQDIEW